MTFLLVGVIAKQESIEVTEHEFDEQCEAYGYEKDEVVEDSESLCYMKYSILKKKVDEFLYSNAIIGN